MEIKKNFKIILAVVFLGGVVLAACFFISPQSQNKTANISSDKLFGWKLPTSQFPLTALNQYLLAYSNIRNYKGPPIGLPVRLKIPIIGVDALIEDALITPDGRMDVPAGSVDVAWFALGPHPGQIGSAVIGGHYGIQNGTPFVFYNLDKLKIGDKVYIQNDKGENIAFQVRSIALFDRNADATTVFTSADGLSHLNLITCEGVWNQVDGNYPERRVVFADLIPNQ
jgi:LPXTG-site transpeptidase (sortase) family protein